MQFVNFLQTWGITFAPHPQTPTHPHWLRYTQLHSARHRRLTGNIKYSVAESFCQKKVTIAAKLKIHIAHMHPVSWHSSSLIWLHAHSTNTQGQKSWLKNSDLLIIEKLWHLQQSRRFTLMLDVNIFFGQVALRFSASQWSVATVERSLRAICAQKYVEIPKSTRPKKRNVALSKLLQFPITLNCLRLKEKMANVLRKLTSF